jgi:DNA repair photolyase
MNISASSCDSVESIPVIREIQCVSILNPSRIPSVDYAINPYTGCEHGCVYCYADFMRRFRSHPEKWGQFVDVKINAPKVLSKQLSRARPGLVSLSTVTDPYQPLERRYRLTRACLGELVHHPFPVSILTKSPLVLRDLDLLTRVPEIDVGITITTLDEKLRRVFEPRAPSISDRLHALQELSAAGIRTWVFFGPVLPLLSDDPRTIGKMLATFHNCGAQSVLVDRLNLYPIVWRKLKAVFARDFPGLFADLQKIKSDAESYTSHLRAQVQREAARQGILCDIVF